MAIYVKQSSKVGGINHASKETAKGYYGNMLVFQHTLPAGTILWQSPDPRGQGFSNGGEFYGTILSSDGSIAFKYPLKKIAHGIEIKGNNYLMDSGDVLGTDDGIDQLISDLGDYQAQLAHIDAKIPKEKFNTNVEIISLHSMGSEQMDGFVKVTDDGLSFVGPYGTVTYRGGGTPNGYYLLQSITAY